MAKAKYFELSRSQHKSGTRENNESAILKQQAETTGHDIHPNYVEKIQRGVSNQQKRLFLKSCHFTLNTDAVNKR